MKYSDIKFPKTWIEVSPRVFDVMDKPENHIFKVGDSIGFLHDSVTKDTNAVSGVDCWYACVNCEVAEVFPVNPNRVRIK